MACTSATRENDYNEQSEEREPTGPDRYSSRRHPRTHMIDDAVVPESHYVRDLDDGPKSFRVPGNDDDEEYPSRRPSLNGKRKHVEYADAAVQVDIKKKHSKRKMVAIGAGLALVKLGLILGVAAEIKKKKAANNGTVSHQNNTTPTAHPHFDAFLSVLPHTNKTA